MIARGMAWLLAPRPATPLAAMRILVGTYALAWLAFTTPELRQLGRLDYARFRPVGIVGVAATGPVSTATITAWLVVAFAAGVAFTAGWRFRVAGPSFALALCWLTTYQNSWGKLLHTENLLVLHTFVLAVGPAADALAVRGRRGSRPAPAAAYGWPLGAMALATVLTYACAGVSKLRNAGWAWFDPDNLRNWIAYDLLRKELFGDPYLPIALPALEHAWLLLPAVVVTLVVELGAPFALVGPRAARTWAISAWLFHVAVLVTMSVVFPYQLTGIAYVPVLLATRGRRADARHAPVDGGAAGATPRGAAPDRHAHGWADRVVGSAGHVSSSGPPRRSRPAPAEIGSRIEGGRNAIPHVGDDRDAGEHALPRGDDVRGVGEPRP